MKPASCLFLVAAALVIGPRAEAAGAPTGAGPFRALALEDLDALFAGGKVGSLPVGFARGTILKRASGPLPRARCRLQGLVWKGKVFHADGTFINQWAGLRAISSTVEVGTSWYDGQPCLVLEYPAGTPVFGNARDELREVAPGLWLGRFYARCPCGKLEGYFVLEVGCGK